jgi:N-glycosylase/DNA lyase
MINSSITPAALETAMVCVTAEVARLRSCHSKLKYREEDLFFELMACILGSQVSFEMATAAAKQLRLSSVFSKISQQRNVDVLARLVAAELSRPISDPNSPCHGRRFRFWRTKARDIAQTAVRMYGVFNGVKVFLSTVTNEIQARERLVKVASGIGPKQASLFLRNVGLADNLAVLDSHVLRYMTCLGMLVTLPRNVGALPAYENAEQILVAYSRIIGYPIKFIDEAIWVVMRVAKSAEI